MIEKKRFFGFSTENLIVEIIIIRKKIIKDLVDYYKCIKVTKYLFYKKNNSFFIFREKKANN
jgi:hypothetical protein